MHVIYSLLPTPIFIATIIVAMIAVIYNLIRHHHRHPSQTPFLVFLLISGPVNIGLKIFLDIRPEMIVSDAIGIFPICWLVIFLAFLGVTLYISDRRNEFDGRQKEQLRHAVKALYVIIPLVVFGVLFCIIMAHISSR